MKPHAEHPLLPSPDETARRAPSLARTALSRPALGALARGGACRRLPFGPFATGLAVATALAACSGTDGGGGIDTGPVRTAVEVAAGDETLEERADTVVADADLLAGGRPGPTANLGSDRTARPEAEPASDAAAAPATVRSRGERSFAEAKRLVSPTLPFLPDDVRPPRAEDRERYAAFDDNAVVRTADEPVSTFSIDVDTGSYANVRRFLAGGALPPADAVRVEELLNYFDYDYPVPADAEIPFSVTTELGPSPWNAGTRLLRIGLKGHAPDPTTRPAANLVFLVDVSGSMDGPDKLGLLKSSLGLLAGELTARDRVAIVTYAGASGVALEPTPGDETRTIARALENLAAGGSTNGEAGIEQAYRLADEHYVDGGVNRVILATDGDFNVGLADTEALIELIERRRASGIALTTLGFGTGNYDDHLMERLADAGDGNHAYIDTLNEARKVLVEELDATLLTIARDVKVQLELNPAVVAEYRLIGYANRVLANEDFTDDRVDAGEIGAGHTVTALYEIALHGEGGERHGARRYAATTPGDARDGEIGELRLRYKRPDEDESRALDTRIRLDDAADALEATTDDFRFASAVAAFGQHLRGDTRVAALALADVVPLAAAARGDDRFGYRGDFVRLVELAAGLERLRDPLTRRRHADGRG